jgi:hypothetical protein
MLLLATITVANSLLEGSPIKGEVKRKSTPLLSKSIYFLTILKIYVDQVMLLCFTAVISLKWVVRLIDADSHQSPIGIKAFEPVVEHLGLLPLVRMLRTPENHRYHTVSNKFKVCRIYGC